MRTEPIWSEDAGREIRYIVCDDLDTLLFLANLGSIPLHLWPSRVGSLEQPDWCVVDLDPKEAPFSDVITIAKALHQICEDAGLPVFIKTTGKSGLHVMIPLGGQCTWEETKNLGELLARLVIREHGKIATITRTIRSRGAKVYLDYLQNRRGQLIAAPFCVRPEPGAPVSMPLLWKEVGGKLDPKQFTIKNAPARMKKLKEDPVLPILKLKPDLASAIGRAGGGAPSDSRDRGVAEADFRHRAATPRPRMWIGTPRRKRVSRRWRRGCPGELVRLAPTRPPTLPLRSVPSSRDLPLAQSPNRPIAQSPTSPSPSPETPGASYPPPPAGPRPAPQWLCPAGPSGSAGRRG